MITVKRVNLNEEATVEQINQLLDGMESYKIETLNWPEEFGYLPKVSFSLCHNGRTMFLRYKVTEEYTGAQIEVDNDKVFRDSCVEFFIGFNDGTYYNIESSCIGRILMKYHPDIESFEFVDAETLKGIKRMPSLGTETFAERIGENSWQIILAIPVDVFIGHKFEDWAQMNEKGARVNLYKCGDGLSVPHYVSLYPIDVPAPSFHQPKFFGEVVFE